MARRYHADYLNSLRPYGEEETTEVHNNFDLIQEISRGALYAGGGRAETWWRGFSITIKIIAILLAVLWVYGYIKMGCPAL